MLFSGSTLVSGTALALLGDSISVMLPWMMAMTAVNAILWGVLCKCEQRADKKAENRWVLFALSILCER